MTAQRSKSMLPTPAEHFGHEIGEDRKLADWPQIVDYFHLLDQGSDRIQVQEVGQSTEGNPFLMAIIAAPETLADLEEYRAIQAKLADPRTVKDEAEAAALIAKGKAVILVTCSVHGTEVGATQMSTLLAHHLVTSDDPDVRQILDNVIFLLVPCLNPDGLRIVKEWYDSTLDTWYEGVNQPFLYHKYVGHDNNRDWYIFSQKETRLMVEKVHNAWHPQIVYDVHQMGRNGARIFVPPWIDPVDPNIDPLITQQVNAFGTAMAVDLTAAGKKGVLIHGIYDYYSPARHYQSYHGALRLLSESASVRFASPVVVPAEKLDRAGRGYDSLASTWNFLEPWEGGQWRLRDIVANQLITFESVLYSAALRRIDLLRNFYEIGRRVIERGKDQAWVIPRRQHDPNAASRLLETLQFGGVEIGRVADELPEGVDGVRPGDYLVRLAQPFGSFAKTLLERQHYPDLRVYPGGPPKQPYDVTAHSLPLLMGVEAYAAESDPAVPTDPANGFALGVGRVDEAEDLSLSPAFSASWIAVNRLLSEGVAVHRRLSDGAFVLRASPTTRQRLGELASELRVNFEASETPALTHPRLSMPRVAIYSGHVPMMDEGWTRWLLDRYEMPYERVGNNEVFAGLENRADVLVLPDARPEVIEKGFDHEHGDGESVVPPEFRGGLGERGADAIAEFVRSGGIVLAFNRAAAYAAETLNLPVENATGDLGKRRFFGPGTLVSVETDLFHPLCYGMREKEAVWFESGPAFRVRRAASSRVRQVLRYPGSKVLASGWLLGEGFLANRAAVVDISVGDGRVVLFGIRPQYRGQSNATFKMVFNGLFL